MKTSPLSDLYNEVDSTSIPRQLLPFLDDIEALQSLGISLRRIGEKLELSDKQIYWALPRARKIRAKILTANVCTDESELKKQNISDAKIGNPFRPGKFNHRFNTNKEIDECAK